MVLVRTVILLLLIAAAICFGCFAWTGQARFKRYGLVILKWTLAAAFFFFAVLIVQRIV